jgi:hypothetical protein
MASGRIPNRAILAQVIGIGIALARKGEPLRLTVPGTDTAANRAAARA